MKGVAMVNNPLAIAGEARDVSSIPGSGRSLGRRNGNPFQYSCWENPTDRGACQATVHGIPELDTTEQLSTHSVKESNMQWKENSIYHTDGTIPDTLNTQKMTGYICFLNTSPTSCISTNATMLHPCRMLFEFILPTGRTKDDRSHGTCRTTT